MLQPNLFKLSFEMTVPDNQHVCTQNASVYIKYMKYNFLISMEWIQHSHLSLFTNILIIRFKLQVHITITTFIFLGNQICNFVHLHTQLSMHTRNLSRKSYDWYNIRIITTNLISESFPVKRISTIISPDMLLIYKLFILTAP